MTQASSPGKLFLFGEYAVLAGSWALIAAVDRRVYVRRTSGHQPTAYRVTGTSRPLGRTLPQLALEAASAYTASGLSIDDFETDVSELYHGEHKLGFGSSAASTVALISAAIERKVFEEQIMGWWSLNPAEQSEAVRDVVFQLALAAHRELQGQRGSGADVAAASFGGVLGFRLVQPAEPFSQFVDLRSTDVHCIDEEVPEFAHLLRGLKWPDALQLKAVWTGKSASSTAMIAAVEASYHTNPNRVMTVFNRIARIASQGVTALQIGDGDQLIEAFERGDSALEELGTLAKTEIVTAEHRLLREHAKRCGLVAKVSGAGGGDLSVVVGRNDAEWQKFEAELPDGLQIRDIKLGAPGLLLEASDEAQP